VSALLDVRGLSTHYVSSRGTRVTRAVDEVSFTLDAGETLGIVGESGCGKTTLALSLLRLLPTAARIVGGEIRFDGEDLVRKKADEMRKIRGKKIAMILQDPMASLNPLSPSATRSRSRSACTTGCRSAPRGRKPGTCSAPCASRRRTPA
jgi:ABC-type dipeptide/oligopeptide/nickel transport system ATPase component